MIHKSPSFCKNKELSLVYKVEQEHSIIVATNINQFIPGGNQFILGCKILD